MRPIRNSVKAIILKDHRLLTIKKHDDEGFYYLLPGGGQEPGEDFLMTLTRECREEIGAEIVVGDIRYIREYIGKHHEFSHVDADVHQVEFMFLCELKAGTDVQEGSVPDQDQIGIEWLPLETLESYRLYPRALRPILAAGKNAEVPIYWGDIN